MMELTQAIRERHSVRSYTDRKIEGPVRDKLRLMADQCSRESGLHIQLVLDEPDAFGGRMGGYGHFKNVRNYIALVGKKRKGLEEDCGYYGEKIVLYAQQLGLNTCWVGLTFSRIPSAFEVAPGEKLVLVIAVGYGADQGLPHKSRKSQEVAHSRIQTPGWFRSGVEYALLAPTAMNQQKFTLTLTGPRTVKARAGLGFFSRVDLGIVKYHFEIGAGDACFDWE